MTSDIDFLRGAAGVKTCVDIIDDPDMPSIPIRKMKAGTDVGLTESMSRERWTAVKWVINQLRIFRQQVRQTLRAQGHSPNSLSQGLF
eukprot:10570574-Karenia_brevis.AAC.1